MLWQAKVKRMFHSVMNYTGFSDLFSQSRHTLAAPKLGGGSENLKQVWLFARLALTLPTKFWNNLKHTQF